MTKSTEYYLSDFLDDNANLLLKSNSIDTTKIEVNLSEPKIPIESIIKLLGINVIEKAYIKDELTDKKEITISFLDPSDKQRFTKAHKLAHILYKHLELKDKISKDETLTIKEKEFLYKAIERQADRFAQNLLLPIELVREVDNIHKNNFRNKAQRIVTLAELFDVSYLSIEHRLEDIDN